MNAITSEVDQCWLGKAGVDEEVLKGSLDRFNRFVFAALMCIYIKPKCTEFFGIVL